MLPGSPLSGGFLSGKYHREDAAQRDTDGRLRKPNPFGETKFTDRNWRILDVLRTVADEVGRPPAQVALAWACARPGVTAPILGASRVDQLHDNIAALEIKLSVEQMAMLAEGGAPEPAYPSRIFSPEVNAMVFGGTSVTGWGERRG